MCKGTFGGVITPVGVTRGGAPEKPPTWKHVSRSHSPHLRQGPSPWGGTSQRTFLPLMVFINWLGRQTRASVAYFFQIASGTGLGAFRSRPHRRSAARNESHMFSLPALARASSMPGKMCDSIAHMWDGGGRVHSEPGKGVPPDHTLCDLDP